MNAVSGLYIRPSKLTQLSLCPGSAHMEQHVEESLGKQDAGQAAGIGTNAHKHGEYGLNMIALDTDDTLDIDTICIRVREHMAIVGDVDTWTMECVVRYVRYVHALIKKYEIEPINILTEHHLDGEDLGFPNGGTADAILVVPFKKVIVIDLKAGYLHQGDADEHDSIMAYAIMAARTFKVESVEVHLFNARAEESERASAATFDAAALKSNEAWTRRVTAAAQDPDAELKPSLDACKFCKALAFCTPAKDMIMKASEALAGGTIPANADEWGALASTAKLAEKFADSGLKACKDRLSIGAPVTGWEIGPPSSVKSLDDAKSVLDRAQKLGDSYVAGFWQAASISRPELDKQFGSQRDAYADLIVERPKAGSLRQVKAAKA